MCKHIIKYLGHLAILWLLLLTVFAEAEKKPSPEDLCDGRSIPLALADESKLKVLSHTLSLRQNYVGEFLMSELSLRNETGKRIQSVAVMIDYLDESGALLTSIVFKGGLRDDSADLFSRLSFYDVVLNKSIEPGEVIYLAGTNLLTTNRFPRLGRVAYLALYEAGRYVDHTWARSNTVPLLEETPDFIELPLPSSQIPQQLSVSILIDEHGHIEQVRFLQGATDPGFKSIIVKELGRWTFVPATNGGLASAAELNLFLRFESEIPIPSRFCSAKSRPYFQRPFVTVDLIPFDKTRWSIYYGGYSAGGHFNHQVVGGRSH